MSSPYDNRGSSRRRHGVWSHWVPLAVTVTVATVGVAAWIWSQRSGSEEEEDEDEAITQHLDYENADYGDNPAYGMTGDGVSSRAPPSFRSDLRPDEVGYGTTEAVDTTGGSTSWGARMSGALRRTPSPQHILDRAGKTVVAGVAAAGTAVGSALAAIREEDKAAFADHETWSEEADAKKEKPSASQTRDHANKRRKTVAIVVSADAQLDDMDEDGYHEHANDHSKIKLFILIYAPNLKDTSTDTPASRPPPSLSSSFSMVGQEQAVTPGEETRSPQLTALGNSAFNKTYAQAVDLVEKEVNVLPFTTLAGYVHILHHLKPEVVYLQESLAGDNGSNVQKLQTWLRHDVILVVGADNGHGGLADSESEAEKAHVEQKWWQREDRVGRGRGVVVVDGMRVSSLSGQAS
ncbi:hypothetical protein M406DRAFT_329889 [Cryphonectria parasitica EP155]|uniref:Peroxin 22-like protein n=1 Tax=Cryphonectria parasitica (strain ATCC 38755 / EP155) TaxID=660469 RepID=A0A9P4Y3V9_CRYP1|nr:uncharacterized protein M406DRAFT_329889 [Cryphonectria parasitica EP155]KAF3766046.1 hypothetical protein M406DRAFT_329889 [Cryphonectria parasitica EP155]